VRIQIIPGVVGEAVRRCIQNARDDAFAHQRALTVAAVRVEAVANDGFSVADYVRHHRDETERHLGEIDVGVGDGRRDRSGALPDLNYAQRC
jgi:hypothetical protein